MQTEFEVLNRLECFREADDKHVLLLLLPSLLHFHFAEDLELVPQFARPLTPDSESAVPRKRHIHVQRLVCVNRQYLVHLILKFVKKSVRECTVLLAVVGLLLF